MGHKRTLTGKVLGVEPWKIRREWDRAKLKVAGALSYPLEPWLERRHFAWRDTALTAEAGGVGQTGKIAIFLIFQPNGIAGSVFHTLRHLVEAGYAPLVVSNAPLSATDKAKLAHLTWATFERPNYGYDFGGYRDGLWYINRQGVDPDTVLFLNDSIWFPALTGTDLIATFEAMDADYVSTQVAERSDKGSRKRYGSRVFFTSYFFLVKRPALASNAFADFWTNYRASSNKLRTIQRGERGFAYAMFDGGIRSKCLLNREMYDAVIAGLDDTQMRTALKYLVCLEPDLEDQRSSLLESAASDEWRTDAIALLCSTRLRNYFGAVPYVTLKILGFPIIKKNADVLYRNERKMIISACGAEEISGLDPDIIAEIKNLDRKHNQK